MSLKFSNIFIGEYLNVIEKYKNRVQHILNNYDVAIFMARKAICFYDAMVHNEIVKPTKCLVLSSRVLDYNMLDKIKSKKIALIDDVVVKGESLRKVAGILKSKDIKADAFVVACEENYNKTFNTDYKNITLKETYAFLNSTEIYTFSAMITEYIESSMCPFNIDQPLYHTSSDLETIKNLLLSVDATNITSGLQKKYNITNKVIYLNFDKELKNDKLIDVLQRSILKIRFIFNETELLAIPFVLFPEITYEELNTIFSLIKTPKSCELVENENKKIVLENKLKLANYLCSELIFKFFENKYNIQLKKKENIDFFQFSVKTEDLFGNNFFDNYLNKLSSLSIDKFLYSSLKFSRVIQKFYEEILLLKTYNQDYYNSNDIKLISKNEKIITNELISSAIKKINIDHSKYMGSSAIDVMIDRGMIVPAIVHKNNQKIVRGYKFGEYSKLTYKQIHEFAEMLYNYQDLIGSDLHKTEFEKLCVIYFTKAIRQKIFVQQADYDDDCYSISYSLYGPRVTMSKVSYKVKSRSALADLFLDDDNQLMKISKNKKYLMTQNAYSSNQSQFAVQFAVIYGSLQKLFKDLPYDSWENNFAHTYIQYLTLVAIGENYKNQFLSLCAELYQMTQLTNDIFNISSSESLRQARIISGINSGLWKYQCYTNDVLKSMQRQIGQKSLQMFALLLDVSTDIGADKNPKWLELIDICAEELFKCAYLLNAAISKYTPLQQVLSLEINNEIEGREEYDFENQNIFNKRVLNCKKFSNYMNIIESEIYDTTKSDEDVRHYINKEIAKNKHNAQLLLDLSDIVIENNNPSFRILHKMLFVYSKQPLSINLETLGLQSINVKGIKSNANYLCIPLSEEISATPILTSILDQVFNKQETFFIIINITDKSLGLAQSENIAQGQELVGMINAIFNEIDTTPTTGILNTLILMGKQYDKSFTSGKYSFILRPQSLKIDKTKLNTYNIQYSNNKNNFSIENDKKLNDLNMPNLNSANFINIGIICALNKETNAVIHMIEKYFGVKPTSHIDTKNNNRAYYDCNLNIFNKKVKILIIEQSRQGNTASAISYSYLTSNYSLDIIIFCGIAGSLNSNIHIGDVVVPREIFDTTLKKEKSGQDIILRASIHRVNPKLLGFIQLLHNEFIDKKTDFNIFSEPLLSDNILLACEDSKTIKNVLQYNDKVAAVEMESAGIYEADYQIGQSINGVITIRGISDNANNVKNDDYHTLASQNAAQILCEFIQIFVSHI